MLKHRSTGTLTRQKHRPRPTIIVEDDFANSTGDQYWDLRSELQPGSRSVQSPSPSPSSSSNCPLRTRSSSISSLSSVGSTTLDCLHHQSSLQSGPLKVFTGDIHAETEYKTLLISNMTTAADVISAILSKFRMSTRDPKLFRLAMHIATKRQGTEVTTKLYLRSDSKPLELEQCHPKGKSKFSLHMDDGVLIRIYDYFVCPESNYKSILISRETTCHEAIRLMLQISRLPPSPEHYLLLCIDRQSGHEYIVGREAVLLASVMNEEGDEQRLDIHLRRIEHDLQSGPSIHRLIKRSAINKTPLSYLSNNQNLSKKCAFRIGQCF